MVVVGSGPLVIDAAQRRRANFFRGTRQDAALAAEPHEHHGDEHALLARAEEQLSIAIQSIAQSRGLGALPPGDVASMVQKATPKLKGMSRQALKSLSPSSPALFDLAISSIAPILTPDAVERLRFEQIKASHHGTGSMPTDEQILRGERPGGRSADGLSRYAAAVGGGVGAENSGRYQMLGAERFTPQQQIVIAGARAEAQRQGVPWFAASAYQGDLLAIGKSGVKAIADVQLREPSYQRLRTDGRFEAREVVTLAEFAKAKGIKDANVLPHATVDVVQIGKLDGEQIGIKSVIVDYMKASKAAVAAPADLAAQQRLEQAGMAQRATLAPLAAQSQGNYKKVQSYEDQARVEQRFRATAQTVEAKADIREVKAAETAVVASAAFGVAPQPRSAGAEKSAEAQPADRKSVV